MSLSNFTPPGADQLIPNAEPATGKPEGAADDSPRLTYEEWSKLAADASKAAQAAPEPAPQPTYEEWAKDVLQADAVRARTSPFFGLGGRRRGA